MAFLSKAPTTVAGVSVYEGLKAALLKVLEQRPNNPVEALETTVLSKEEIAASFVPPLVPVTVSRVPDVRDDSVLASS